MSRDRDDMSAYRALRIEIKQIANDIAEDFVKVLQRRGYATTPFDRYRDARFHMTLNAIATWIPDDDSAPAGDGDAAAAPTHERGRSREKSAEDDEIEAERNRANERGRGAAEAVQQRDKLLY